MKTYDVVVLGLGTMGSATILELSRRGISAVGFDRWDPPHSFGSHSGDTRTFRKGYSESPRYVPLAEMASRLWGELEEELESPLLHRIGLMIMGPSTSKKIIGIQNCQNIFDLDIDTLSAEEIRYRYPAFNVPDDFIGLLERGAGWIDINTLLKLTHRKAASLGARLHVNEEIIGWDLRSGEVRIKTNRAEFSAKSMVITAGPWVQSVLDGLRLPLHPRRKTLFWFDPVLPELFDEDRLPIYGFPPNSFYGFPNILGAGVKVSEHLGGEDLSNPDTVRPPDEKDSASLFHTIREFLPRLAGLPPGDVNRVIRSASCLYTMTPDGNFILDVHPEFDNVVFATGFSGHGFKFAPLVGAVMADLLLYGRTEIPIEFLRLGNRPKLWIEQLATG